MTALNVQKACKKSSCVEIITHCKLQSLWYNSNLGTNKSLLNIFSFLRKWKWFEFLFTGSCGQWWAGLCGATAAAEGELWVRLLLEPRAPRPEARPNHPTLGPMARVKKGSKRDPICQRELWVRLLLEPKWDQKGDKKEIKKGPKRDKKGAKLWVRLLLEPRARRPEAQPSNTRPTRTHSTSQKGIKKGPKNK